MTNVVLTTGSIWLVPSDWSSTNTIYCIGAGGNGGGGGASGGGGAACAFTSNIALVPGALVLIQIGTPGGTTGSGTAPTANTWFNSSALVAAGGQNGNSGGAAGSTANSAGGTKYAGGAGGAYGGGSVNAGGGGAGGNTGAGAAGTNLGVGGQGDNGTGGTGGTVGTSGSPAGGNGAIGFEILAALGAGGGGGVILITYTSTPDVGQATWPMSTTDTPAFIAHKINPHLMADRNYDDTGAMQYASNTLSVVNTFVFDADGGPLPLKSQYVETVSQRYNALYGMAYDDTGARAWGAFIIPAPTPKVRYDPGVTDILPLQGYIERQTQLFSLLRGQAYDDTGAREYGAFVYLASTPKASFGADGGLLPIGQYVEAQTQRFSMLRGQAYSDTGAMSHGASIQAVTPKNQFSAEGGPLPMLGYVEAKAARFGTLFNTVVFSRPPVYRGLQLIPNIFFVAGNEFISNLNATINVINYNLQILNIPRSYFFPLLKDLHPNGFADTLNILVKQWNSTPAPLGITSTNKIKLFLSVGAPELTLAVNTLIDEMNVFIIALQAYT